MMLRRDIDVPVLVDLAQPVFDAIVVHEMQNLLASTRGSEAACMRNTHGQGECKHGGNRDEGSGGAETHAGPTYSTIGAAPKRTRVKMP